MRFALCLKSHTYLTIQSNRTVTLIKKVEKKLLLP